MLAARTTLCFWLCLGLLGGACTSLEPTMVTGSDADAASDVGSTRDDAGLDDAPGKSDAGTPAAGGSQGPSSTDVSDAGGGPCVGDGDMAQLAAGSFVRGESSQPETSPTRNEFVDGFAIDVTEVTVAAYAECVEARACTAATGTGRCNGIVPGTECHPINCVTWQQAAAYCAFRDKRLPTELEWEFAARGKDKDTDQWWPWAEGDISNENTHYSSEAGTAVVGSHPTGTTPAGVLDLAGNVWEWTSDAWCDNYEETASCDDSLHAGRGGGWNSNFLECRVHSRKPGPTEPDDQFGLRCVK